MNSKQVLQVDYNQQNGLMLGWKYTDLNTYLTFFRHIIVLFTDHKENFNIFLTTYLKRIRPGDLYTFLYFNEEGKLKMKSWKQKTNGQQAYDFIGAIQGNIMLGNKQALMRKVQKQFEKFSDPTIVTLYIENVEQRKWFEAQIKKQRSNQKYDFVVGIFGPFTTAQFAFDNHVNILPFKPSTGWQTVHFYLNQIYQSAILWASVTIECLNASVSSFGEGNWKNVGFNAIQRVYRGPTIKYERDFLHFYGNKNKQVKYNLRLKLTYVTLQRRKFVSEKIFSVNVNGGFNKLTFSLAHWNNPYHLDGDIWLKDNPYRSLTVLKFQRQNTDKQ